MKNIILDTIRDRDIAFLAHFCAVKTIDSKSVYVCNNPTASEVLTFLHEWDAALLVSLENHD